MNDVDEPSYDVDADDENPVFDVWYEDGNAVDDDLSYDG